MILIWIIVCNRWTKHGFNVEKNNVEELNVPLGKKLFHVFYTIFNFAITITIIKTFLKTQILMTLVSFCLSSVQELFWNSIIFP